MSIPLPSRDPQPARLSPHSLATASSVFLRVTQEPGGPSRAEQAKLLYDKWLLDAPKILDLCVLYGPSNRDLTSRLVKQVRAKQAHHCRS